MATEKIVLRRYWFLFDRGDQGVPLVARFGCGVTAWTKEDAMSILQHRVLDGRDVPQHTIIEDVDVSALDANHVLPNMAPPSVRGIWYPLGYQ
jgi:hypothetical protein